MSNQVQKEIESRLETTFHIRANFEEISDQKRLNIIGKLTLMSLRPLLAFMFSLFASLVNSYDSWWQAESVWINFWTKID